ncbi:hypothetical protein HUT17_04845 (plasmid) [Nocardiopsis flavescens]|nr:hypothetical protein HUT17_04845 [Nocardiopsis flavescens]
MSTTTDTTEQDKTAGSPPMAALTGSDIITVLERAWARIRADHPEVPEVTVVTGSGYLAAEPGTITWGHHWAGRWRHDAYGRPRAELFIAGELLNDGAAKLLETMLHEAAHALAKVRGIVDTCDEGSRYHNKEFLKLAQELGLQKPEKRDKKRGFSACTITDATKHRYRDLIEDLDQAGLPYLAEPLEGWDLPDLPESPDLPEVVPGEDPGETTGVELDPPGPGEDPEPAPAPARSGARVSTQCSCAEPRRLSVTPAQLDAGPILCGLCLKRFTVVEEPTAAPRPRRMGRPRPTA